MIRVYNLLGEIIETLEVLDDKELMDEIRKTEEIIKEYPELSLEDIKAALLYAARLTEKEVLLLLE